MTFMKNVAFQRPAATPPAPAQGVSSTFIEPPIVQTSMPPVFSDNEPADRNIPLRHRLSNKLLLMTILAVLITQIIILAPSIANMRNQWLTAKHNMVTISSLLLLDANPDAPLTPASQLQLLHLTDAQAITITRNGESRLLAGSQMLPIDERIDLTVSTPFSDFWEALHTLINGGNKVILLSGPAEDSGTTVDIVMNDEALHNKLIQNSRIIATISLLISLIAAALIYFIIHRLLLRPVGHMYMNMLAFGSQPDDPTLIIDGSCRKDELGYAQNRLAEMQNHLQRLFHERKHLADLGLAVSKINHDMRNILASAQLMSDSLALTQDPAVQRYSPKLIRTLNRAISYSETVMAYGRTQEAMPVRQNRLLRPLIHEVEEIVASYTDVPITFHNMIPADFEAYIDKEQMLRVLTNLYRNSVQAMIADTTLPERERSLTASAWRSGNNCCIAVADTGPGLPKKALDNLFTAFHGSARNGGTGLGLVIVQELVRAHGGTIEHREDYKEGTLFEIRIPDRPVYMNSSD